MIFQNQRKRIRFRNGYFLTRYRFLSVYFRYVNKLAFAIQWSKIGSICSSRVAPLVSLVPIFGFVVLYNERIKQYLTLEESPGTCGFVEELPFFELRVDILYIGLVTLGLAFLLFGLCAPAVVKRYGSGLEYASAMRDAGDYHLVAILIILANAAKVRLKKQFLILKRTVGRSYRTDFLLLFNRFSKSNFPHRLFGVFQHLVQRMDELNRSGMVDASDWFSSELSSINENFHFDIRKRESLGRVGLTMNSSQLFTRYLANNEIQKFKDYIGDDVFFAYFVLKNNSNFAVRLLIVVFLILGLLLSSAPTLMTLVYAFDKFC